MYVLLSMYIRIRETSELRLEVKKSVKGATGGGELCHMQCEKSVSVKKERNQQSEAHALGDMRFGE